MGRECDEGIPGLVLGGMEAMGMVEGEEPRLQVCFKGSTRSAGMEHPSPTLGKSSRTNLPIARRSPLGRLNSRVHSHRLPLQRHFMGHKSVRSWIQPFYWHLDKVRVVTPLAQEKSPKCLHLLQLFLNLGDIRKQGSWWLVMLKM